VYAVPKLRGGAVKINLAVDRLKAVSAVPVGLAAG
jgi:hypothetical protein